MNISIKRFDKNFPLPEQIEGAACFDFICRETVTVPAREMKAVRQNVAIKIPKGHALLIFSRSSTPLRKGLMLANGVGVIDPFYSGDEDEYYSFFFNATDKPVIIKAGEKLAQGMIVKTTPVTWNEVDSMNSSGHGGYQHFDEIVKP